MTISPIKLPTRVLPTIPKRLQVLTEWRKSGNDLRVCPQPRLPQMEAQN